MAEASSVNVGSGCEEKGPEELSQESARPGTIISRVKLFDTMVDTFLQKLVAAGSVRVSGSITFTDLTDQEGDARRVDQRHCFQRFTDYYKSFYQLQPEMTQRIHDKFITQLQTSIQEEISEIKAEGNLEAVLIALDTIVEESKDRTEPAWRPSGIPEKDLRSAMAPYLLQQRGALQRRVQKQEAENRQLADAVLAGRRQLEELQLQAQARQQAWQALHREQKELLAVLKEPE
ncbi:polyamine-modulated factor 1 isoform X1 [Ovis canadensis]|uniref:polyamine-modulated factor 1 isoform X1 n=1 Tax=Ovis canadensis TaxID=37174 RepID=UPI0037524CC3